MREWIPISTSPKGRLALAAVRAFGSRPFDEVTVADLAREAEVTTGALYHHFDSKLGLYDFVRADVERRLLDRVEGAAAAVDRSGDRLGAALAVGFDFAVDSGFARILAEAPTDAASGDALAFAFGRLCNPDSSELGALIAAAWRTAVARVADGDDRGAMRLALLRLATA
ncbi:TetR/AcrR family transcriptional regulator [Agromyces sp. LHK192]|uniref:TetR/AcrR family transcriptional regulator n=1 Tax=Agromyces sp. LHK192 TaxID=2498704 RepID=UPI00196B0BF9|nr:TetR/AcrR family transcriptional regulator [Agromyces sp. LHK192]